MLSHVHIMLTITLLHLINCHVYASARNWYPGTRINTRTRVPVSLPGYPSQNHYPNFVEWSFVFSAISALLLCVFCGKRRKWVISVLAGMWLYILALDINASPLEWWKHNGNRYPRLSLLALKYIGIPATSVQSERVFSKAGEIVSRRRASLKPSNVNCLVFLSKNLSVVQL